MQAVIPCKPRMRGQWNSENASVISADDGAEPTVAITAGNAPWWKRMFPSFAWLRGKIFLKNKPVALFVVIGVIAASVLAE